MGTDSREQVVQWRERWNNIEDWPELDPPVDELCQIALDALDDNERLKEDANIVSLDVVATMQRQKSEIERLTKRLEEARKTIQKTVDHGCCCLQEASEPYPDCEMINACNRWLEADK